MSSRYVCIRERGDGLPGILVKGMGKLPADVIQMGGLKTHIKDMPGAIRDGDESVG